MHIHERTNPLQIQIESLSQRNEILAADLRDKEEELSQEKQVKQIFVKKVSKFKYLLRKKYLISLTSSVGSCFVLETLLF